MQIRQCNSPQGVAIPGRRSGWRPPLKVSHARATASSEQVAMLATIGMAVPSVKKPARAMTIGAEDELEGADQRRRRAGIGAVAVERQHRRRRNHQARGSRNRRRAARSAPPAGRCPRGSRRAAASWPSRSPVAAISHHRPQSVARAEPAGELRRADERERVDRERQAVLARASVRSGRSARMKSRPGRRESSPRRRRRPSQREEPAVAQQHAVGGQRIAQAAVDPLVRRPRFGKHGGRHRDADQRQRGDRPEDAAPADPLVDEAAGHRRDDRARR